MDAIALDPRLRHSTGSLGRNPLMLIDGKQVPAVSGKTFAVYNPATGGVIANVPEGDKADVDLAVRAARRAFDEGRWAKVSRSERGRILWRIADLIERNLEELAELESIDNGKPYAVARVADLPLAVDMFRYMGGWATKITGTTLPLSLPGEYLSYTVREPVGVVGQIIPWNFPLLMAAWKIAPALAAGCTIVLKAAEQTPLTALRLAELIQEAGVPDGVVNILTGFRETAGAALAAHPDVDKVAFTGSTEVGKLIVQAAAGNLKKVSLELGGKSPAIILPDADIDLAIAGAANAIFFNHGQCCCAGSRLHAHKEIYDKVVAGVADIAGKIKVGPGLDPATEMGPLVSDEQFARVTGYIEDGRQSGAKIAVGGNRVGNLGYFVQPTVMENTTPDMKVIREEIFGPVVCATPFSDDDLDAIAKRANDTIYGLAAAYGPATAAPHTSWPAASVPAPCGSTATTCSTPRCRSAATSSPAGAARWARRYSTTTPRSRRSPRPCEPGWTSVRRSRQSAPMNGEPNDSELRPGEVAVELPATTDAGVYFIGTIHTPWRTRSECPKRGSPDGPICSIVIDARWREALTDIAQHKRIQVLYWMHHARRDLVLQTPFRTGQTTGSFALRSPVRPNPIASSVVELVGVEGTTLQVRGLDCLDGTPLIDLKPERTAH